MSHFFPPHYVPSSVSPVSSNRRRSKMTSNNASRQHQQQQLMSSPRHNQSPIIPINMAAPNPAVLNMGIPPPPPVSMPMRDYQAQSSTLTFRNRFEAGRGFDLDDDLEFCPSLLTEDDYVSIHSAAASDRSSLSSVSPDASPLLNQLQPHHLQQLQLMQPQNHPDYLVNPYTTAAASSGVPTFATPPKSYAYGGVRTRNAIPIVNPNTGMRVGSPQVSPHSPW